MYIQHTVHDNRESVLVVNTVDNQQLVFVGMYFGWLSCLLPDDLEDKHYSKQK